MKKSSSDSNAYIDESITISIQRHLSLLECCLKMSEKILLSCSQFNIDKINDLIDNRQRLIDLISTIQVQIESYINDLPDYKINSENIKIFKSWFMDLQFYSNYIIRIDELIIRQLDSERQMTSQEIASLFKIKTKFKGYSLSNSLNKDQP